MPLPMDNPAALSCGCNHQQNFGGVVASGDFTNIATNNAADGVYTLNGQTVDIEDIIDLANENTSFDPMTDIDAGGIMMHTVSPGVISQVILALTADLKTQMLASGYTMMIEAYFGTTDGEGRSTHAITLENWETVDWEIWSAAQMHYFHVPAEGTSRLVLEAADGTSDAIPEDPPSGNQVNKLAVTVAADRMVCSLNGGAIHTLPGPGLDPLLDTIYFSVAGNDQTRLRSFEIYELVDDADLPTLSAL